jgi:hypothetical protein
VIGYITMTVMDSNVQQDSEYQEFDLDGDGIVSDDEMLVVQQVDAHEKSDAQRKMAWVAMVTMIVFTLLLFLPIFSDSRITALADLFGLFYIGMAGIVGSYFGMTAYMSRK